MSQDQTWPLPCFHMNLLPNGADKKLEKSKIVSLCLSTFFSIFFLFTLNYWQVKNEFINNLLFFLWFTGDCNNVTRLVKWIWTSYIWQLFFWQKRNSAGCLLPSQISWFVTREILWKSSLQKEVLKLHIVISRENLCSSENQPLCF